MLGHAYRGVAAPRQPRYFDDVDTVTGTPEADTFEVETNYQGTLPLRGGIYKLEITPQLDPSNELDILVYQEKERVTYLDGFQAPTARSYTYIEDFEPVEDEIIVGDNPDEMEYEIDASFMPMLVSCHRISGAWICI